MNRVKDYTYVMAEFVKTQDIHSNVYNALKLIPDYIHIFYFVELLIDILKENNNVCDIFFKF